MKQKILILNISGSKNELESVNYWKELFQTAGFEVEVKHWEEKGICENLSSYASILLGPSFSFLNDGSGLSAESLKKVASKCSALKMYTGPILALEAGGVVLAHLHGGNIITHQYEGAITSTSDDGLLSGISMTGSYPASKEVCGFDCPDGFESLVTIGGAPVVIKRKGAVQYAIPFTMAGSMKFLENFIEQIRSFYAVGVAKK